MKSNKEVKEIKKEFSSKFQHFGECRRDDVWNFIESTISQTRQEVIEDIIDEFIKFSQKYWVDRPMGSPMPLIVNKKQFKMFILEDLNKK